MASESTEEAFAIPRTSHNIESVVSIGTINVWLNERDRMCLFGEEVWTVAFQQRSKLPR